MAEAALNDDDPIYVAVSKDVRESKSTLLWALRNLRVKKLFLLHVHQQVLMNPSSSGLEQSEIDAIQDSELKSSYESLHKYSDICQEMGVIEQDVDISLKLANHVAEGIVELIYEYSIKKLVMGAAVDSHYTEGMIHIKSTKAEYVSRHAPHRCKIWLVCNGKLIQMREGRFDSSYSSSSSLSSLHGSDSALIPYEVETQRAEHDTESLQYFQSARGFETMYYEEQRRLLEIEELKREMLKRESEEASSSSFGVTQMMYNKEVTRRREAEEELNKAKAEIKESKKVQKELEKVLRKTEKERDEAVKTTKKVMRSLSSLEWSASNEPPPCFICPISLDIMDNPHVAADGYTYEANEFKRWLSHGGVKSPMTNLNLDHHNLTPNIVLRTAIKDWLQHHPQNRL